MCRWEGNPSVGVVTCTDRSLCGGNDYDSCPPTIKSCSHRPYPPSRSSRGHNPETKEDVFTSLLRMGVPNSIRMHCSHYT